MDLARLELASSSVIELLRYDHATVSVAEYYWCCIASKPLTYAMARSLSVVGLGSHVHVLLPGCAPRAASRLTIVFLSGTQAAARTGAASMVRSTLVLLPVMAAKHL